MTSREKIHLNHSLEIDRPIVSQCQDRLDRASLAKAIAHQVRLIPAGHGFTIAVVGEWGSGKTSVLNMVTETLKQKPDSTAVLHFNPWLFGNANDLVMRFFHELSAQLGRSRTQPLKDIAKALSAMGRALAPFSPVNGTISVTTILAVLIERWTKPPSPYDMRDQLTKALNASKFRVVVIVDDIDRLEPYETREIMRLIRLMSDLPKVVFVVAFDSRHVARSLGKTEAEGRQYLDKIIQISHDLPLMRQSSLHEILLPWLADSLKSHDLQELDQHVWSKVFYDVIKPISGNIRDVKRYLHSLPVTLDIVGREVALADLLCLEALRILRPALFDELRIHAEYLVHPESESGVWMTDEDRITAVRGKISAMLDRAKDERELLDSVLAILFPATQGSLGRTSYGPHWIGTWRKQRRVACKEVLDIYLQAGLNDDAIPLRDLQALVAALTDERRLVRILDAFDPKRFEVVLERLEDFEDDVPIEAVTVAVPVLVNRMQRLSNHPVRMFSLPPRSKATRIVLRLLTKIEDPASLSASMPAMLTKIDNLSGRFALIEMVGHRESAGDSLLDEDQVKALKDDLTRCLQSATHNDLANEWNLFSLLLRTMNWLEGEEKVRLVSSLHGHLADDGFVLTLLRTSVSYVHYNGHAKKRLYWEELTELFGTGIAEAVDRLALSPLYQNLSADDQNTITLAKKYCSGWHPRT